MTPTEKHIAAKLLEMAGDKFGNHGCNDMDPSAFPAMAEEEKRDLARQYARWNKHEPDDDLLREFELIPDFGWMLFLAAKMRGEA